MLRKLKWRVLRSLVADYRREGLDDFWILTRIARDVYPDYKFRWPDWDWLKQERFWAFVRELDDERGVNADRKWMLGQLFRLCIDLPGDTAECGVLNGASSVLICEAIARRGRGDKTHQLFDSFEGLSEPGAKDGSHWSRGDLKVSEEDALKNLDPWSDFVVSHLGWIPERFHEVQDRRFCYVHVDVDLHQPTRDSIEFFYPRLTEGGILVCDDYGSSFCPGATEAFDIFMHDKPEAVIALPVGGGFIIKGRRAAEPGPYFELGVVTASQT
jgi:hypothetical protein